MEKSQQFVIIISLHYSYSLNIFFFFGKKRKLFVQKYTSLECREGVKLGGGEKKKYYTRKQLLKNSN